MWRSDFALRQKAAPSGDVQFEFHSALAPEGDDIVMHEAVLQVNGVSTGKTRMVVMLPDHFEYVAGSVTVDGERTYRKAQQLVGAGEQVLSATTQDHGAPRQNSLRAACAPCVSPRMPRLPRGHAAGARLRHLRHAGQIGCAHATDRVAAVARRGALRAHSSPSSRASMCSRPSCRPPTKKRCTT
jgi:hypothetical protein